MLFLKKIVSILCLLVCIGCANTKFYFFGVDSEVFTQATNKEATIAALGAITSVATHVTGHWLAGELWGVDWHFEDSYRTEYVDHYDNDNDLRWFARGGFVLQNGIGLVLTSFEKFRYSYFTKGFVATTAIEVWTYPILHRGYASDFRTIDYADGNGDLEWGIYSTVALHNLLRVPWTKEINK